MPSHRANAHGTACEYHLAEKYNVRLVDEDGKRLDTSWYDGLKDGTPWKFKVTARRRAAGQLQDLREVSREVAATGRVVRIRRVSAARDRDTDFEDHGRSGVEVTDAPMARRRESPR